MSKGVTDRGRRGRGARGRDARGGGLRGALGVATLVVLVPLAAFVVLSWLAGWRLQHVRTGSMEPTHPVGALVVSTPIDASEVEVGMPVTFRDPADEGRVVTHRVVRVERDEAGELGFVTQGDANVDPDAEVVPAANVQSRVRWSVPHLGAVLEQATGPWGVVLLAVVPVVLFVWGEVRERRHRGEGEGASAEGVAAEGAAAGSGGSHVPCAACDDPIEVHDRYCRHCGAVVEVGTAHEEGPAVVGSAPRGHGPEG